MHKNKCLWARSAQPKPQQNTQKKANSCAQKGVFMYTEVCLVEHERAKT